MKWLDRQITNHWLRMNVRAFLWLTLAFSAVNVLLLIAYSVMGDGASITKSSFYDLLLFYVKILVIPLPVINLIYLVQHKKQFANVSVWYLTGLKFLALFTGIAIGTVISFGVEEFLREWSLITDPNLTVTIQSYQLSPLASNLFSYGVIGVIIALPVFIQQARKQEIDAKLNRQELQVIRLKQMKSRAELQTLQAKINPHFLYNSLNSIASLIHDNPDKAEEMVLSLSELFRYSTNSQGKSFSSVKEEVKMVQTYIDVEKVRFGENLNFVLHLGDGVENYFIPRFLIQPLVENVGQVAWGVEFVPQCAHAGFYASKTEMTHPTAQAFSPFFSTK